MAPTCALFCVMIGVVTLITTLVIEKVLIHSWNKDNEARAKARQERRMKSVNYTENTEGEKQSCVQKPMTTA